MPEINFAELQHQLDTCPTDEQCYGMGQKHRAYGWAPTSIGKTGAQHVMYMQGFNGKPLDKDCAPCESCEGGACTMREKCVTLGRGSV
jgi:hypothetical protein